MCNCNDDDTLGLVAIDDLEWKLYDTASLVAFVQAIHTSTIPPTINLENPDPDCDLDYTANTPKERNIEYAMSNSFGFGGHNASIIVRKYDGS